MVVLLTVLHVIFCLFLILVILLQTGKGAGMGVAFGGASSTVFGPRGAGSFIGKATAIVAALFMITSLLLAWASSSKSTGIADKAGALAEKRAGEVEEVDLGEAAAGSSLPDEDESVEPELEPPAATADGGAPASGDAGAAPLTDGGTASEPAADVPKPEPAASEPPAPAAEQAPAPDTPAAGDAGTGAP
jgi:preprotein translocase subunit SecG